MIKLALLLIGLLGGSATLQSQPANAHFEIIGKKFVAAYVGSSTHCFFWSLDLPNPWRVEVACYDGGDLKTIYVSKAGERLIATYVSSENFNISWIFTPSIVVPPSSASPLINYSISINNLTQTELVRIDFF